MNERANQRTHGRGSTKHHQGIRYGVAFRERRFPSGKRNAEHRRLSTWRAKTELMGQGLGVWD